MCSECDWCVRQKKLFLFVREEAVKLIKKFKKQTPIMTVLVCVMLQYINLLLMMMAGAGLSTATLLLFFASSTKYPLRSPLLLECRVATAALTSVAATLTLLGLLLQAGLGAKTWRRPILITYSAMMAAVVCCEACAAAWLCWRLYLLVADQRLVAAFSWNKIYADIVKELTPDRPYVLYVAGACAVFCAVLQCLAFLLAILASRSSAGLGTVPAERQQSADRADNKTLLL
ncbi:uncharacterized protein LOC106134077 [Amyelois transitella]|uniref:uncharacterized protein LOC106134077 n=1 Tax=Amyelois transitella TaxID=680683 RepID=UPI00298F6244|nr:uncharacterized protein LOC106134077 [Amyelois transitella]